MQGSLFPHLNNIFFQDVWNDVRDEQRLDSVMVRHNDRFVTGCLQSRFMTLDLPPGKFNIYILPHIVNTRSFLGVDDVGKWIRTDTLVCEKNVLWHVYDSTGLMFPKSHVYIYVTPYRTRILVAISSDAILKLTPSLDDAEQLYMTFYRNPNINKRLSMTSATLESRTKDQTKKMLKNTYQRVSQTSPSGTNVWINGTLRPPRDLDMGENGDIVEIVSDPNVDGCFAIHPQKDRTKFFSHKDEMFKEIVHIPKCINPDNNLITHNSCTLYVEDANTNRARYLHRICPTNVTQITHNDLAVSSRILSSLKQAMSTTDINIYVQVRTYKDALPLKPNRSFLSYLYDEDDEDILGHLQGSKSPTLSFWQAAVLEQSGYVRMMFDIPSSKDANIADFYQDAIGYINLAKELSAHKSVHCNTQVVSIRKPYFLQSRKTRPLVFKNGRLVPDHFITYKETMTYIYIDLSYFYAGPSNEVAVHLFHNNDRSLDTFTPTGDAPTKMIPKNHMHDHVHMYRRISLETPVESRSATSTYAYEWIDVNARPGTYQIQHTDNDITITWASSQYDETFVLVPTTYTQHDRIDISSLVQNQEPLIVPVKLGASSVQMPVPDEYNVDVYLNGYTLIPNLDYTCMPIKKDGNVALMELIIASVDKLHAPDKKNMLDVQIHARTAFQPLSGFMVDTDAPVDVTQGLPVWVDGLSCGVIDNRSLIQASRQGRSISFDRYDTITTGHPYHIQVSVPEQDMRAYWSEADFNADKMRWQEVAAYLDKKCKKTEQPSPDNETIVIEKPHKLYSPYVMSIIKDVIEGDLILRDDPNDATFLDQFMGYTHLWERDPIYQMHTAYKNEQFVDVQPTYADTFFVGADVFPLIDRLLTLILQETRLLERE